MLREKYSDKMTGLMSIIQKGDLILSENSSVHVDFDMDELKSIEDDRNFAMGIRIFQDFDEAGRKVRRTGNSYISSVNDMQTLVPNALQSAEIGDEIDFDLPGTKEADIPRFSHFKETVEKVSKEEMISLGDSLKKSLKEMAPESKVNVSVSKSSSQSYQMNTSGMDIEEAETRFSVSGGIVLVEDQGGLLYLGESDSGFDEKRDLDKILSHIEWRLKHAVKKASVRSGYLPVLFTADAMDLLLDSFFISANGNNMYKEISILTEKIDKKIFDDKISITDDPLSKTGLDHYGADDEGVPASTLPLVENGVFKNYISDLKTAERLKIQSSGHGRRSAASMPSPSFSNIYVKTGDADFESMVRSIDYGLIVDSFLGGGMSNIIAGDFSVNIELGFLVENGEIKGRVKDVMLSGNAYDVLSDVTAVENKAYVSGSDSIPSMLFPGISVAG